MATLRLIVNHITQRKVRTGLTVAAIGVSISLVIAMSGGLSPFETATDQALESFYGTVDVSIKPKAVQANSLIGPETIRMLKEHPQVKHINRRLIYWGTPRDEKGKAIGPGMVQIMGMRRSESNKLVEHPIAEGRWFKDHEKATAVLSENVAKQLKKKVGDKIYLPSAKGLEPVEVIGIAAKPEVLWMEMPTIHLPLGFVEQWLDVEGQANRLDVDLVPGADVDAFVAEFSSRPLPDAPPMAYRTAKSQQQKSDRGFSALQAFTYLGASVAAIAAMFIVFSTLSMGISERSRTLAMLRAIGATKGQVAALVMGEGVVLAAAGLVLGIGLGYGWCAVAEAAWPKVFVHGARPSVEGVIVGILLSIGAATLASLLPAWQASRVKPLDALTALGRPRRRGALVLSTLIGLVFIAVDPIIVYGVDPDSVGHMTKLRLHLFVGLPALMIGLFACAPLLATAIEACFGWVTARLFAVPPVLLKQQLTGGLWRTAGTAAALMVGLAALTAIQTQGHSTLKSWKLPNRFPDLVVLSTSFLGIQDNQIRKMESMEGVDPDSVMPMVMVTPGLGTFIAALSGPQKLAEKTIMFGIDPVKAFGTNTSEPRIELDFIQGDLATAQEKLSTGRYILVSEEFYKLKEKGLGDKVELDTPAGKVSYEIAGVVRSAGADLIMRMYTLENEFEQWTTAAVMTSLKNVEKDFGKQLVRVVLLNLKSQENKAVIEKQIKKALGQSGLQTADSRQIKRKIDTSIQTLMLLLNIIAMAALAVAALGVTNTMVASVRSRQWQLGILRSQGLGRGAMIRLIVCEAFLIGALATVMGLGSGWLAALWGNRVSLEMFSFAPSLVPPWSKLSIGVAVTVATAVLASLWPAFQVAYTQTLRLLRADRAAT